MKYSKAYADSFKRRLNQAMSIRNLKQIDIRLSTGISRSLMSQYVNGYCIPKSDKLYLLAKALNVNEAWLMGLDVPMERIPDDVRRFENVVEMPKLVKVPLVGDIACGEPILAEQNIEDYINMPVDVKGKFALRCKGDSMINARIFDGDIVFINPELQVENGQIAAVLVDDPDTTNKQATLKRVYFYENRIELRPENPMFPVLNFEGKERASVRIIGKAVGFLSTIL